MHFCQQSDHDLWDCEKGRFAYQRLVLLFGKSGISNMACYIYDKERESDQSIESLI